MKKNKLNYKYDTDYHALAIVTAVNDYRITHFLNKMTGFDFKKKSNLFIDLPYLSGCKIEHYIFLHKTILSNVILLKNKIPDQIIFKKFKNIDYFLLIEKKDHHSYQLLLDLHSQLTLLSIIQAIFVVENNQLNLKNLIYFE